MYCPCFVLPYQGSPSLWNTLLEVFTHTFPPPPPGACGIVDGSTDSCFALVLAGAVMVEPLCVAGAVCAIPAAVNSKLPPTSVMQNSFERRNIVLPPQ